MPSTQMQKAYEMWRDLGPQMMTQSTIEGMRKTFDEFFLQFPAPADVEFQPDVIGDNEAIWASVRGQDPHRLILWLHGGGYCMGSAAATRGLAAHIAKASDAKVLILDYRLAPEVPFPGAVEDAMIAYRSLTFEAKGGSGIFVGGDSAGGGLAIATAVALRDAGDPMPAGVVAVSPVTDLAVTGDSVTANRDRDPIDSRELLENVAGMYLAGQDPRSPLASPLYADLAGLPPLFLQVGTEEVLLDDSVRIATKARDAGNDVTLEIADGAVHEWHVFASFLPEARDAIARIGAFVQRHTP
jgi:monoterpene epsilon-lactone hydrolase